FKNNTAVIAALSVLMAALTVATTGITARMTDEMRHASPNDPAALKTAMQPLCTDQKVAIGLVAAVQAMSILAAISLAVANSACEAAAKSGVTGSQIGLTPADIT